MHRFPPNTALLLVDVQLGFDHPSWGQRNNLDAEHNIARLLAAWREAGMPVIHVRHISQLPDSVFAPTNLGNGIKPIVAPLDSELVVIKHVNSAFIGTGLAQTLRDQGIETLVIVGLTTDHCVSTTVRMAANLGFNTYCISDATATFERTGPTGKHYTAQQIHDISLASLNREFATILNTTAAVESLCHAELVEARQTTLL